MLKSSLFNKKPLSFRDRDFFVLSTGINAPFYAIVFCDGSVQFVDQCRFFHFRISAILRLFALIIGQPIILKRLWIMGSDSLSRGYWKRISESFVFLFIVIILISFCYFWRFFRFNKRIAKRKIRLYCKCVKIKRCSVFTASFIVINRKL